MSRVEYMVQQQVSVPTCLKITGKILVDNFQSVRTRIIALLVIFEQVGSETGRSIMYTIRNIGVQGFSLKSEIYFFRKSVAYQPCYDNHGQKCHGEKIVLK